MNIHGLKLFYQVATTGSFTKAAEILRISQPAVSSQIKRFEHEIGVQLFKQQGRGVVLTEFGEALAEKAQNLIALEHHIETFIEEYRLAKAGNLHIVATYLPANFLIPKWAAHFKAVNEHVNLMITTTNTKDAFEQLIHYKADIAIYGGGMSERPKEIEWEELYEDELWFVVSPTHRYAHQNITLVEMFQEPFIMREEGSSMREHLFSLCQTYQVKPPNIALQFNGINETIRSVMAGYGANFISSLAVREYVENGQLARVYVKDIHAIKHKIAICTRNNEKHNLLVQKFIETIKSSPI
ncbi:LysR family transcriptional regulator [Lysinibacillus irui]|uniref:LysR family transcriptional regulator n=1 Tax=Lysinibacillus irui TaxID=2998077 RepID=A0AAJ5RN64_9BACI|nr:MULTISPECIES: LysR family transcriptional regulator [Lysinibacillus]MEA0556260.1 LysR family transcriptional regulator [Lysinibacillus irui]MEA0562801.1 LysR family transcriptional regulator [Lysinibacillus irui]MEA0977333.1 LysR family transcriptional regulator [Lysinibacillus irui]MEA1043487.1 LysR family transcriptional regulator [Lysinibacillus irui]WDV07034.1 LysR family transcriptional regulator [Lysinibacillus irui]